MPAKSKKQLKFMQAVANNPEFAKKVGVPTKVGKEFTKETKVKKYEKGGKTITPEKEKARIKEMAREDRYKKIRERDMKLFGPNEELTESDKREAVNNALLKAGLSIAGAPYPERTRTVKPAPTKGNPAAIMKKKGGKIGMGMTKNNYKKGGKVSSCSKRADGCAVKGKTKGRMV